MRRTWRGSAPAGKTSRELRQVVQGEAVAAGGYLDDGRTDDGTCARSRSDDDDDDDEAIELADATSKRGQKW